jgi:hypothetical protein
MHPRIQLLAAFISMSVISNAQFKKGDRMVGSSISSLFYNSGSSDVTFPMFNGYKSKSSSYGFRLEPSVGWFISENAAVGGSININPTGQKVRYEDAGTTFQEDKSNNFNIGLGAFARYYISDGDAFMPYGQFGFNLGISSVNTEGFRFFDSTPDYVTRYEGKSSGGFFANAAFQLGLTRMLGENAGLDLFAGYTYSYNKNTFKTTTTTDIGLDGSIETTAVSEPTSKYTNHGFIIGAGIQVFLRKKK